MYQLKSISSGKVLNHTSPYEILYKPLSELKSNKSYITLTHTHRRLKQATLKSIMALSRPMMIDYFFNFLELADELTQQIIISIPILPGK